MWRFCHIKKCIYIYMRTWEDDSVICGDKCMNIYVYICIYTYVQTLVNVYINVNLYNTYLYISTYIYTCIYIYIVAVSFSVCCGVLRVLQQCGMVQWSVCCRVYVLKSVWYGAVKCVLQGLCVEKCVVRCAHLEWKTVKKSERETNREMEGKRECTRERAYVRT